MRIGELAEKARTTTSTLRYYEERGLLPQPERTTTGYRSYGDESVQRLEFIDRARAAGLTLAQTAEILNVRDSGQSPCEGLPRVLLTVGVCGDQAASASL